MKRFVALVISFVFLVSVAHAELDLSEMSIEELVSLKTQIVGELMQRGEIKSAKVPAGEYVVGTDIPAGAYTVTTSSMMIMVSVMGGGSFGTVHTIMASEEIGRLVLVDGQTLEIVGGNAIFTLYSGLTFE